jgi:deoxyadenosine/deoxycytidine kinase
MAAEYLILAGPQAAGKSTLGQQICKRESRMIPLQESRQAVIHNSGKKGAIFMSYLDELEAIHHDMTRMFTILGQSRSDCCYLDETNIFTLGHARAHGIDLIEGYFRQYCDLLCEFNTSVLFIDVPPPISWERRRYRYAQRLWDLSNEEAEKTMVRYKTYLDHLYPELFSIYDRLEFPKIKIDGTLPVDVTLRLALEAIKTLRHTAD